MKSYPVEDFLLEQFYWLFAMHTYDITANVFSIYILIDMDFYHNYGIGGFYYLSKELLTLNATLSS